MRHYNPPPIKKEKRPVVAPEKLRFFRLREAAAHRQSQNSVIIGIEDGGIRLVHRYLPTQVQAVVEAVRVQQNRLARLGIK